MNWNNIPSLAALKAFEAAARHGSFSAAARDLNVTHAAIGQHVRTLEDHFGQSLMRREGRGMALTENGRMLADAVSEAFGLISSASADLLDRTKKRAVRVAVTPSFAANWLMPHIGGFWDKHPEIEVELIPSMALVDLRRDNIDVAIRYGKGGWAGVASRPLMAAGHVAVASPHYLNGRDVTCLADLKGSHWLMDGTRSEEQFWIAENGVDLDNERVTVFPTGQLSREAARAGLGITVLPAPIAAPDIKSGAFVTLCHEQDSAIAYHVLTRPEIVSATRDIFVKWLKSEA